MKKTVSFASALARFKQIDSDLVAFNLRPCLAKRAGDAALACAVNAVGREAKQLAELGRFPHCTTPVSQKAA